MVAPSPVIFFTVTNSVPRRVVMSPVQVRPLSVAVVAGDTTTADPSIATFWNATLLIKTGTTAVFANAENVHITPPTVISASISNGSMGALPGINASISAYNFVVVVVTPVVSVLVLLTNSTSTSPRPVAPPT